MSLISRRMRISSSSEEAVPLICSYTHTTVWPLCTASSTLWNIYTYAYIALLLQINGTLRVKCAVISQGPIEHFTLM